MVQLALVQSSMQKFPVFPPALNREHHGRGIMTEIALWAFQARKKCDLLESGHGGHWTCPISWVRPDFLNCGLGVNRRPNCEDCLSGESRMVGPVIELTLKFK
ncbi:hypothetical protein Ancab_018750 [Ancistrocladus abbreviatus]